MCLILLGPVKAYLASAQKAIEGYKHVLLKTPIKPGATLFLTILTRTIILCNVRRTIGVLGYATPVFRKSTTAIFAKTPSE
jgi:hypothetical protein